MHASRRFGVEGSAKDKPIAARWQDDAGKSETGRQTPKRSLFRIGSLSSLGGMAKGGGRAGRGEWEPSSKRHAGVAQSTACRRKPLQQFFECCESVRKCRDLEYPPHGFFRTVSVQAERQLNYENGTRMNCGNIVEAASARVTSPRVCLRHRGRPAPHLRARWPAWVAQLFSGSRQTRSIRSS